MFASTCASEPMSAWSGAPTARPRRLEWGMLPLMLSVLFTAARLPSCGAQFHSAATDKLVVDLASDVRDMQHGGSNHDAFKHYDTDEDGHLTKDDIYNFLTEHEQIGGFFSRNIKTNRLFNLLDDNKDGMVSKAEFLHAMRDRKKAKTAPSVASGDEDGGRYDTRSHNKEDL